jgi:hypothetical protein
MGCTVTCVAVMVVPLVVPSTRTLSPVMIAFGELGFVPFWYVVDDASSTVTFWPADVVMVKPDEDTLATVPDAPPAAGPDRALGALPLDPLLLPEATAAGGAAVDEPDLAMPTESPITPHISAAAAAIHRRLLFVSNRRTFDRRAIWAAGAKTAPSGGEDGGGEGVANVLSAGGGSEVAFDAGRSEGDS